MSALRSHGRLPSLPYNKRESRRGPLLTFVSLPIEVPSRRSKTRRHAEASYCTKAEQEINLPSKEGAHQEIDGNKSDVAAIAAAACSIVSLGSGCARCSQEAQ